MRDGTDLQRLNRRLPWQADKFGRLLLVRAVRSVLIRRRLPLQRSLWAPRSGRSRLIRGKTREMLDKLTTIVFPAFEFDRSEDAVYDDEELLMLETLLGATGTAATAVPRHTVII